MIQVCDTEKMHFVLSGDYVIAASLKNLWIDECITALTSVSLSALELNVPLASECLVTL